MAVFKCKMCGGNLEIQEGMSVCECEYCGTKQTIPKLNDERRVNLYDRANHFRRNNDFDKAMGIYEQILSDDSTDAEAYWSLVLCKYGIEYVEDPASHKRIPTVNRAQYTSIFDDANYLLAIANADISQKHLYEEEAKAINEIQKGILEISQKEEPFDVFICYKETDNNGRRTQDSVLANDLYHQLTQEGLKVFFARITLEDKLGTAYEPYIFAALNSSKVMVVLGTRQEYFNAVWVKNEWSRFLSLVKESNGTKYLIPAYRDMDPYDLPDEFSHLQAQDMSKLGFMQDLIRGINKIVYTKSSTKSIERSNNISDVTPQIDSLLERAEIFLEDADYGKASEYADRILDSQPQNAKAYLILLLAKYKVASMEMLINKDINNLEEDRNFQRILKYGDSSLTSKLIECADKLKSIRIEQHKDGIYKKAICLMSEDNCESLENAEELFCSISDYKDASEKALYCKKRYDEINNQAVAELNSINECILNEILNEKNELLVQIEELHSQLIHNNNRNGELASEIEQLTGFFSIGKKKELERTLSSLNHDTIRINSRIEELKSNIKKLESRYAELEQQANLGIDLRTIKPKEGAVKIEVGLSGTVLEVISRVGDHVSKGDTIIMLGVMMMEMSVVAPATGVISTINVSLGESVEAGQIVATMDV